MLSLTHTLKQIPNSKWIIIFVHWLTSDQDEEIFVQWEKFFNENWFSTIRFSLYWASPNERKLSETCLQNNIDDTNTVIKYAKDLWFKKIFLVWHSYGCLSNLFTDLSDVSWLIMRDSSMAGEMLLKDVHEDEDWYFIDWWDWYKHRIGEKYYQDFQADPQTYLGQISKIHIPVKIFWAENWLAENARLYFDSANEPKSLTVISGAYHRFQWGWAEELFSESLSWIESNPLSR